MPSLYKQINGQAVIDRGYILAKEAEAVNLSTQSVKVRLVDTEDGSTEGIWLAFLRTEDRELYDNEFSHDEEIQGILLNNALAFFPNPSWGRVVKGRTKGRENPVFVVSEQLDRFKATNSAYHTELENASAEGEGANGN